MDAILKLDGVEKVYHPGTSLECRALQPANLEFTKGRFYAIVGKSGSGKSTMLHILGGLDRPTGGKVYLEGKSVFDLKDRQLAILRRRRIGFVFQSYNLLGEHTARENISIPLNLDGRDPEPAFFREVTQALGIETLLDKYPDELSGGEQQRVAIARMLVQQVPIMVFDDSLSAVDAQTDAKIRAALRESLGKSTVILISHRITTLMQADRILVLDGGRVADLGSHRELISRPGTYKDIYDIQMSSDDRRLLTEGGEA